MSVCLTICGTTLSAQTRFSPPDTTVNLARYASGEECFAALSRANARADAANTVWRDTLYPDRTDRFDSLSTTARTVARECAVRHRADTLPVEQYERWLAVFLAADRDADAKFVVDRRLATLAPDSVAARKRVLKIVYETYEESRPVRVVAIESILSQLEQLATGDRIFDRFEPLGLRMELAQDLYDTTMERQAAEQLIAFSNTLTPQQRKDRKYETLGRQFVHRAMDIVRRTQLSDSLRKSATAYVALKQANWAAASGQSPASFPSMVGKQAAPIEADFWYPDKPASGDAGTTNAMQSSIPNESGVVRPTPGRAGLLMFLQSACHEEGMGIRPPYGREALSMKCWATYAMLRRLKTRFPTLEITIVSKTSGYVGSTVPLAPRAEADLLRHWWLDYHHLPATLAVANTQFFRLPAPDKRRIDNGDANQQNYTVGDTRVIFQQRAYIVDPSGIIIYVSGDRGTGEQDVVRILSAVIAREHQNTAKQ